MIRIATLYEDLRAGVERLSSNPSGVRKSQKILEKALASGGVFYGVNTGFGALASTRISSEQLHQLQRNLLLSHAVGTGAPVPKEISRLMLELKVISLGLGFSGVSESTFRMLTKWLEKDLIPVVPQKGSLGASGDLAPLAHLFLPLMGMGHFWNADGKSTTPAEEVLKKETLEPIELQAKDGLALINGTQFMTAYGAFILEKTRNLLKVADIVAAMSLEALQGSITPFDERIHAIRPHKGQQEVSENVRMLLRDSQILESHRNCGKVQDPYCLRCVPQVHGATRDAVSHVNSIFETEMNSVTDNPIVMENGDIVSGGNFHGQPLAMGMDYLKIALAELASISERRIYLLLDGHDGLPALLMRKTGINSGFMIPQYTAAALVSENKVLCHPASVDSIPSSLGQEDHVSMGAISAIHLLQVFENVRHVLAIELFTAAQALDFRKPLLPGIGVLLAHECVRNSVPFAEEDHFFQDDIKQASLLIEEGHLVCTLENKFGNLN